MFVRVSCDNTSKFDPRYFAPARKERAGGIYHQVVRNRNKTLKILFRKFKMIFD